MMQWIGLDHGLLYGLEHARQEYATNFMLWVTFAGNWQCLIFIVIVFAYFFTKRPNGRQAALGLALGYLICLVTTETFGWKGASRYCFDIWKLFQTRFAKFPIRPCFRSDERCCGTCFFFAENRMCFAYESFIWVYF